VDDRGEADLGNSRASANQHDGLIEPVETNPNITKPFQDLTRQTNDDIVEDHFQPMLLDSAVQQPTSTNFDPRMCIQMIRFTLAELSTTAFDTFDNAQTLPDILSYGDSSLAEFLRDIMVPCPPTDDIRPTRNELMQPFSPKDILDFSVNYDFDFEGASELPTMLGTGQAGQVSAVRFADQSRPISRSGYTTPNTRAGIRLSTQAFKESLWSFEPVEADHGRADQVNLSLPFEDLLSPTRCTALEPPCASLDQISRDRLLAMILATCEQSIVLRILSSFPSSELLTNLLHNFLLYHTEQTDTLIHLPTLEPSELSAEVLLPLVAAGAALSTIPVIRRLGYAFQEASRETTSKMVCSANQSKSKMLIHKVRARQSQHS
jgi:hypothetical protein